MLEIGKKEFWFVPGAQGLYGQETLDAVRADAQAIVDGLNASGKLPYPIVLKDTVISAEICTSIMKEANYLDDVAGVITWMHTFSPAKMWIRGEQLLQKPLLHLATQFNESIPWDTIDMDFMNLNQSAHGDREYGFINARLGLNNKVVVGWWRDERVQRELAEWMDVAVAYVESFNLKVASFGNNMRLVAVTDGDRVEAQIKFGWRVDEYYADDLVGSIDSVSDADVDALFAEYHDLYDFEYGTYDKDTWTEHVKYQAKQELGIKKFLDEGGYTAFSTSFEDLGGQHQLSGLASQRLAGMGYGFGPEGDWKSAALNRFLKIVSHNQATGFMEDYTYELAPGQEQELGSHMMEVDPTLAATKPKIVVAPLFIGDREDPARLVFEGKSGDGVMVTTADFGTGFRVIVNELEAVKPVKLPPHLPVAPVTWKPKPDFYTGVKKWIEAGGGHHDVMSLAVTSSQIETWGKLAGVEVVTVK